MAVAVFISWEGMTSDQYETARQVVNWEGDPPSGLLLHVSAFGDQGLQVTDIWESAEDFQAFVQSRLMPGMAQMGVSSQPETLVREIHALFTPGFQRV
ncbi:hypothetical protein BH23CHL4_BH23CHL4_10580 [soil metagenome]